MLLEETWLKVWIFLGFVFGRTTGARPRFDTSTDMRQVLIPADAEVDSVIFRLRATDQDADFPLVFDVTATITPVVRIDNLPCTSYNKVCQANVILTKRLVPGRFHDFAVRVTDSKGDSDSMQATISVTNATTPRDKIFPHIPSLIMVPEDTRSGKELDYLLVRANSWSGKPVYIELWQPKELFTIRQRQTPLQTRGVITLIGELDFETQSMYTLTMYATDPYTEPRKDTRNIAGLNVVVVVQDVQDVPPLFTLAPPLTRINNSVQPGDVILRVHAEDGDKGVPRDIAYGLVSEGNPFTPFFNISETTGEIVLARPLEELTQITHVGAPVVLRVVAEEIRRTREEPPAQATVVEVGLLLGEPGNSPPYFKSDNYMAVIDENPEPGTVITFGEQYPTEVRDEDIGKAGVFALKLENNNGTFEINPTVAERNADFIVTVRDNALIDYELYKSLMFRIVAQEVGPATNLSTSVPVTIFLKDVNDNPPIFDEDSYEVTLSENVTAGTRVLQVRATDKDTGVFGSIRYTGITGQGSQTFAMDPNTGLITVAMGSSLDREAAPRLQLSVEARDENGTGNRGVVPLLVNLLDVNDNAPIFESKEYVFSLNPELTNFTSPAVIKATDADAEPPNNVIRYEIVHGNYENKFNLNEITGELILRSPITKVRRKKQSAFDGSAVKSRKDGLQAEGIPQKPATRRTVQADVTTKTFQETRDKNESWINRTRRTARVRMKRAADDDALYILTARAYDLGVPHLSSVTKIQVVSVAAMDDRIVMFVLPEEHPDPEKTAKTLATITGARVTVLEIRPYMPMNGTMMTNMPPSEMRKSTVVARVEKSTGFVDIEKIRDVLAANGVGIINGTDVMGDSGGTKTSTTNINNTITSVHNEEVIVYKAENKLLLWLLIILGLLMLVAIAALIICCICPGCPFYMAPRKRRVHSSETLIVRADGRPKRHLHRKQPALVDVGNNHERKQAWSADPARRSWQFNRRNTKNCGLASLPGDVAYVSAYHRDPRGNAEVARPREESMMRYDSSRRDRRYDGQDRLYLEDIEAQRTKDYVETAGVGSLRRQEMERDYGYGKMDDDDEGTSREQHFYREGNAEVLRLVTRGQVDDDALRRHPAALIVDGKDIILRRFMEDQKIRQDASLQDLEGARSLESHRRTKELAQQQQQKEIILIPDGLDLSQRQHRHHVEEIGPTVQRLVIEHDDEEEEEEEEEEDEEEEDNDEEIDDAYARENDRDDDFSRNDGQTRQEETTTGLTKDHVRSSSVVQSYSVHDIELARQNVLLTRLLLERESSRALGPAVAAHTTLDTTSYLETQSLPGQVAIATQTDRTAATQTERQVRSRSDNDESEEESRFRKKTKTKKRYESDVKRTTRTTWVKSPIEEERSPCFDKRLSILRKKVKEVRDGRRISIEPDVLREISDSLDGNGSSGKGEEEETKTYQRSIEETSIKYQILSEEAADETPKSSRKRKAKFEGVFGEKLRETSGLDATESTSSPEEPNASSEKRRKDSETSPRKGQKRGDSVVKPSFRILEREITMLTKKLSKLGDRGGGGEGRQSTGSDRTSREKSTSPKKESKRSETEKKTSKRMEDSTRSKAKSGIETTSKASSSTEMTSQRKEPATIAKTKQKLKYQKARVFSTGSSELEEGYEKFGKPSSDSNHEHSRQKQPVAIVTTATIHSQARTKPQSLQREHKKTTISSQDSEETKRRESPSKEPIKADVKPDRPVKTSSRVQKVSRPGPKDDPKTSEEFSTSTSSEKMEKTRKGVDRRELEKRTSLSSSDNGLHRSDRRGTKKSQLRDVSISERPSREGQVEDSKRGTVERAKERETDGFTMREAVSMLKTDTERRRETEEPSKKKQDRPKSLRKALKDLVSFASSRDVRKDAMQSRSTSDDSKETKKIHKDFSSIREDEARKKREDFRARRKSSDKMAEFTDDFASFVDKSSSDADFKEKIVAPPSDDALPRIEPSDSPDKDVKGKETRATDEFRSDKVRTEFVEDIREESKAEFTDEFASTVDKSSRDADLKKRIVAPPSDEFHFDKVSTEFVEEPREKSKVEFTDEFASTVDKSSSDTDLKKRIVAPPSDEFRFDKVSTEFFEEPREKSKAEFTDEFASTIDKSSRDADIKEKIVAPPSDEFRFDKVSTEFVEEPREKSKAEFTDEFAWTVDKSSRDADLKKKSVAPPSDDALPRIEPSESPDKETRATDKVTTEFVEETREESKGDSGPPEKIAFDVATSTSSRQTLIVPHVPIDFQDGKRSSEIEIDVEADRSRPGEVQAARRREEVEIKTLETGERSETRRTRIASPETSVRQSEIIFTDTDKMVEKVEKIDPTHSMAAEILETGGTAIDSSEASARQDGVILMDRDKMVDKDKLEDEKDAREMGEDPSMEVEKQIPSVDSGERKDEATSARKESETRRDIEKIATEREKTSIDERTRAKGSEAVAVMFKNGENARSERVSIESTGKNGTGQKVIEGEWKLVSSSMDVDLVERSGIESEPRETNGSGQIELIAYESRKDEGAKEDRSKDEDAVLAKSAVVSPPTSMEPCEPIEEQSVEDDESRKEEMLRTKKILDDSIVLPDVSKRPASVVSRSNGSKEKLSGTAAIDEEKAEVPTDVFEIKKSEMEESVDTVELEERKSKELLDTDATMESKMEKLKDTKESEVEELTRGSEMRKDKVEESVGTVKMEESKTQESADFLEMEKDEIQKSADSIETRKDRTDESIGVNEIEKPEEEKKKIDSVDAEDITMKKSTDAVEKEEFEGEKPIDDIDQEGSKPERFIDRIEVEASKLKEPVDTLETKMSELKEPIDTVEMKTSKLKEPIDTTKIKTSKLKEPIDTIKIKTSKLEEPIDTVEMEASKLKKPIDTVKTKTSKLEEPIDTVKTKTSELKEPIDTVQTKTSELKEPIDTVNIKTIKLEEPIDTLGPKKIETKELSNIVRMEGGETERSIDVIEVGEGKTQEPIDTLETELIGLKRAIDIAAPDRPSTPSEPTRENERTKMTSKTRGTKEEKSREERRKAEEKCADEGEKSLESLKYPSKDDDSMARRSKESRLADESRVRSKEDDNSNGRKKGEEKLLEKERERDELEPATIFTRLTDTPDESEESDSSSDASRKTTLATRPYETPRHRFEKPTGKEKEVDGEGVPIDIAQEEDHEIERHESERRIDKAEDVLAPKAIESGSKGAKAGKRDAERPSKGAIATESRSGKMARQEIEKIPTRSIDRSRQDRKSDRKSTTRAAKSIDSKDVRRRADSKEGTQKVPKTETVVVDRPEASSKSRSQKSSKTSKKAFDLTKPPARKEKESSLEEEPEDERSSSKRKAQQTRRSSEKSESRQQDDKSRKQRKEDDRTSQGRSSKKSSSSGGEKSSSPPKTGERDVGKTRSKYMAWYKQKREETGATGKRGADTEREAARKVASTGGTEKEEDDEDDEEGQEEGEEEKEEGKTEELEGQLPSWSRRGMRLKRSRQREERKGGKDRLETTPRTRRKVKPLVNVESEQLKAIVRQGRKLRKAEGGGDEDPPVQIFAGTPPASKVASPPTDQASKQHRLLQHSEYKYEKMPAPFYLHPPAAPHPSPQLSPERFQSGETSLGYARHEEEELDSGIAVSLPTGARLRNQQLLEKKSVFDIAYSEAAPSHLRSDSTTPPS